MIKPETNNTNSNDIKFDSNLLLTSPFSLPLSILTLYHTSFFYKNQFVFYTHFHL